MRSLVSTIVTIAIGVAYIVAVVLSRDGLAALVIAMPYLLTNMAAVTMLVASLFSKPIKTDERWGMFVVAMLASNAYAFVYFSGISLVSPERNLTLSVAGVLGTFALVPFYVIAVYTLGAQLTVMPEARRLVTTGPYAVSRHPLYVLYILWFGLQVLVAQSLVIVLLSALMIGLLVIRARSEEAILRSAFPDEYAAYAERVGWVGRWTPALLRWDS